MKKQRKTVSKCPTRIKACLRPMAALTLAMTAISSAAQAQGIVAGAGRISDTIIQLINIAFPVACGLALIAVIWFVFTKNPQWKDYTVGLFIGLLLWGGYTTYKDEIFSYFNGGDQFTTTGGGAENGGGGGE